MQLQLTEINFMSLVSTDRFKTSIDIDLNKHAQTNLWSHDIYIGFIVIYIRIKNNGTYIFVGHIYY